MVVLEVLTVVLAVLLLASLGVVAYLARQLGLARTEVMVLESSLEDARRVRSRGTAERAVRAVLGTAVETAARVRDQGVTGLLRSSIDDLATWALTERPEIRVTAPDGTVTILFSDIEGSTALNDRLGDKDWVKLLGSHDALVRAYVEPRGGQIVKAQGDGFMIVFRSPLDAVDAAVEIQRALAHGRGRRLRRTPIRVRIGIHCGQVITREGDYFGRSVSMAARVGAVAEGGEILVSDPVRRALGEAPGLEITQVGTTELKGIADPQVLWCVTPA